MITLEHVSKSFQNGKERLQALDDVSLSLPDKGMVFLLGKSGSGKSTLLNLVGGLDTYDGTIDYGSLGKVSRRNMEAFRRENIGYVFQDFYLDEESTVFENIRQGLSISGIDDMEEVRKRADSALKAVSLSLYKRRKASQLSLGQKQRVAIARAIAAKPKILLADEPTGNLDSKNGENVMSILKGLSRDILVLVVSHNEGLAYRFADVLYRIADGKIQEEERIAPAKEAVSLPKGVETERMDGEIGSIAITLYQEKGILAKESISILRTGGKTYIHLPKGFEVVAEEIQPVVKAEVPETNPSDVRFDTAGFDDSKRKGGLFHKALFRNMMSRKGNRILVVISILLALIIPICLGLRFTMYEQRKSMVIDDFSETRQLGVLNNGVEYNRIEGYLDLLEDPDSGILSPYLVESEVAAQDFEVLKPPYGIESNDNAFYGIGFLSLECLSRDEVRLLPSSLSFSSLSYGDILIDKYLAMSLLSSLKAQDYDDIIGTKWHFYGVDGRKKDYTIAGILDGNSRTKRIYFAGLDSKDVFFLSALSRSQDPEATFDLSDLRIRILTASMPGGENKNAFGSKVFREEMRLCSMFLQGTFVDFDETLADSAYPEDEGKKVLYLPEGKADVLERFTANLIDRTSRIPILNADNYPDVTYVDTLSAPLKEKQIGIYLSKDLYDSIAQNVSRFPVLDEYSSMSLDSDPFEVVVQGYFTGDGDLPSILEEDFRLPLLFSFSTTGGLDSNSLYGSSGIYFRFHCRNAEETISYLEENRPEVMTLSAKTYFEHAVDTKDIDLFYVAILVVTAFLLALYAIFFKTRLAQDESVLAIYRALGLDKKVILAHYLCDILGKVTLFFVLPYIAVALFSFFFWDIFAPVYVHVLAILITYLLVVLFVLLPLGLTLLKTPREMLLKKDI